MPAATLRPSWAGRSYGARSSAAAWATTAAASSAARSRSGARATATTCGSSRSAISSNGPRRLAAERDRAPRRPPGRRPGELVRHGRHIQRLQHRLPHGQEGRADGGDGAVPWRKRGRQGDLLQKPASAVEARERSVHRRQLCGHPGTARGIGTVRRREGRIHRRDRLAPGPLRARAWRHPVPRRDRHVELHRAGQASARAAGGRNRAGRGHAGAQGRRARHRRHQRQPARRGPGRLVPRGSVLPPQRLSRSACPPCATVATTFR